MSAPSSTKARRRLLAAVVGLGLAAAACKPSADEAAPPAPPEATVAAATSLRNVLPALIARYGTAGKVSATYGASGDLRKQVEGGAPVDLVLFASRRPVEQLAEKGLVDGEPVRLATNRLVLIGPASAKALTFATLATIPAGDHLAIGDPGAVPAGDYAKQALQKLGSWDALQDRIVLGGDVAGVLAYARRGEVAAAIVYKTETAGIADVRILDEATGEWAPTAEVLGAVTRAGTNAAGGRSFLEWLRTADAQKILVDAGFGPP